MPAQPYIFDFSQGNLIIRQDYDGSNNAIYIGWAQPGAKTSDSVWRILNQVFNGVNLMTNTGFPNASTAFSFVWDNRTTYTYS